MDKQNNKNVSVAREIITDYKMSNKRLFALSVLELIVIFVLLVGMVVLLLITKPTDNNQNISNVGTIEYSTLTN